MFESVSALAKTWWGRSIAIVYVIGIIAFLLPQIPNTVNSLIEDYEAAFFGHSPAETVPMTNELSASVNEVRNKLTALQQELGSFEKSDSSKNLEKIEAQLNDLKATIFGDPEKALTIQRLNLEMASLRADVEGLRSQSHWLFGMTLTLALGVLGIVISVIKGSFRAPGTGTPRIACAD